MALLEDTTVLSLRDPARVGRWLWQLLPPAEHIPHGSGAG